MDAKLRPANRITQRKEFDRLYRMGRRFESVHVKMLVLPNDQKVPRLGLTVPKRVGNSVVRNRLKRLVREWFRTRKDRLTGLDLMVQPAESAAGLDFAEMSSCLDDLVERLRQS